MAPRCGPHLPQTQIRPARATRERRAISPIGSAGAEAQTGPYAASGGQPGHAPAWESAAVNPW